MAWSGFPNGGNAAASQRLWISPKQQVHYYSLTVSKKDNKLTKIMRDTKKPTKFTRSITSICLGLPVLRCHSLWAYKHIHINWTYREVGIGKRNSFNTYIHKKSHIQKEVQTFVLTVRLYIWVKESSQTIKKIVGNSINMHSKKSHFSL